MSLRKSDVADAIAQEHNETFVLGECVFIRTVSFSSIGRITRISNLGNSYFIHLEEACMVADTERWMNCIEEGQLREVEPVKSPVRVHVDAIVDVWAWNHPLPREQK